MTIPRIYTHNTHVIIVLCERQSSVNAAPWDKCALRAAPYWPFSHRGDSHDAWDLFAKCGHTSSETEHFSHVASLVCRFGETPNPARRSWSLAANTQAHRDWAKTDWHQLRLHILPSTYSNIWGLHSSFNISYICKMVILQIRIRCVLRLMSIRSDLSDNSRM